MWTKRAGSCASFEIDSGLYVAAYGETEREARKALRRVMGREWEQQKEHVFATSYGGTARGVRLEWQETATRVNDRTALRADFALLDAEARPASSKDEPTLPDCAEVGRVYRITDRYWDHYYATLAKLEGQTPAAYSQALGKVRQKAAELTRLVHERECDAHRFECMLDNTWPRRDPESYEWATSAPDYRTVSRAFKECGSLQELVERYPSMESFEERSHFRSRFCDFVERDFGLNTADALGPVLTLLDEAPDCKHPSLRRALVMDALWRGAQLDEVEKVRSQAVKLVGKATRQLDDARAELDDHLAREPSMRRRLGVLPPSAEQRAEWDNWRVEMERRREHVAHLASRQKDLRESALNPLRAGEVAREQLAKRHPEQQRAAEQRREAVRAFAAKHDERMHALTSEVHTHTLTLESGAAAAARSWGHEPEGLPSTRRVLEQGRELER